MAPDAVLDCVIETARATPAVVALYLFGSRSQGTDAPASDVDLAALGDRPIPLAALVDLQLRFQEVVAPPVDLVDLRAVDAFLALDVIRGERICCRDEFLADEFELFVMRRAGDLEPFERERRRILATAAFARASSRG